MLTVRRVSGTEILGKWKQVEDLGQQEPMLAWSVQLHILGKGSVVQVGSGRKEQPGGLHPCQDKIRGCRIDGSEWLVGALLLVLMT